MPSQASQQVSTLQEAQRKARFGHRDWIGYTAKDGVRRYVPRSIASLKAALLAMGTKGRFTLVHADSGCPMVMNWRMGINDLYAAKRFGW